MKVIRSCLINQPPAVSADKSSRSLVSPVSSLQTQTGVVLAISLIILLLLTLIGLSATQSTALEEKMAGNLRDKNLTFQVAESALRVAEQSIQSPAVLPTFTNAGTNAGIDGFYTDTPSISLADAAILTDGFWINNPVATSPVTNLGNSVAPFYFIQRLGGVCLLPCSTPRYFKITVRATGGTTSTVVILQSIKAI